MSLPEFNSESSSRDISDALKSEGAVIVRELVDKSLVDKTVKELRPAFDKLGKSFENNFNGFQTLRIADPLAHSGGAAELTGHSLVMEVIDQILLPFCINYRIGSTTGIDIQPGEGHQILHTDGEIYPVRIPGMEFQVSVMWALDDFSEENGATRVVPRSHLKMNPDPVDTDQVAQAVMPRGSALLYLGSVIHGGGENRSASSRMGLINTYALGWLRQEVNQYLTLGRERIAQLPERVQRLLGYQCHGPYLGRYDGDPDDYWSNKHKNRTQKAD